MKIKYNLWASLMLTLFALFWLENTIASETAENNDKTLIFLMSDNSETHITVKSLQQFSIKIKSTPSTGYGWSFQQQPDETFLKFKGIKRDLEDSGEDEKEASRKLFGAPQYEKWQFQALRVGETTFQLKYHRPWEKDVPPLKTHTFYITIH